MLSGESFVGPWRPLKALVCLLGFSAIVSTQRSQIPTFLGSNSITSEQPENLSALLSRTEDVIHISERVLSPSVLASSMPMSRFRGHKRRDPSHNGLLLRSSSYNLTGVGGYPIFALPIVSSDLADILGQTQADLQTRNGEMITASYYVNTTKWSFSVTMANTTLPYATVEAVVARFLKLSSTVAGPQDIVSTRVAVIFNESTPIADIVIMPYYPVSNSSDKPFSNFGNGGLSTSRPNEIFKITPFGSSCAYQVINETAALAPYLHEIHQGSLRIRSNWAGVLIPLAQATFYTTIRIWRDPIYGIPVEVNIWTIQSVCIVAFYFSMKLLWRISLDAKPLMETMSMLDPFDSEIFKNLTLDTGYYQVGRLVGRVVIQATENVASGRFGDPQITALKLYVALIKAILMPLKVSSPQHLGWGMEGEVYGTSNATSLGNTTVELDEGGREVVARWQISMRDRDEL